MGTGKSTVGRVLAQRLGLELVDTDALIEARHGPIPQIFAQRGEDAFRDIERGVAAELADRTGLVVSTGGRLMLDPANAATLGGSGDVFCLSAEPEEIHRRITADTTAPDRPLLAGDDPLDRIRALLAERAAGYGTYPQIATGGRTPDEIAEEIIERLEADGTATVSG